MISEIKNIIQFYKEYKKKQAQELPLIENFNREFEKYNSMASDDKKAKQDYLYPCLHDKTSQTEIEPIYFYQDSWAFERIFLSRTTNHVDIGSHHKFVALLSKIVKLTMVDIRPLSLQLDTINFLEGSILNLPFSDNSINSLSSLCVIEHIGLGRYGDPLDPSGSEKAFKEITRVLNIGGDFYMSVPIEEVNKVYFNAHRAFNEEYLLKQLLGNYEVVDKKYIYGNEFLSKKNKSWGIGCYHVKKIK